LNTRNVRPSIQIMKRPAPYATAALVALILYGYGLEMAAGGLPPCDAYGLVPAHWTPGSLVWSLFLHDPDHWSHVAGNVVCLAYAGRVVERAIGHLALLALYLTAGVAGGLLHVLVDPRSLEPMVGASGAVCGVLAVAGALRPRLLPFVVGFALANVWYALVGGGEGVSFGTHLGGFAVGVLAVAAIKASGSTAMEAA
jgi:membrane associated rhomboid family serine protease